METANYNYLRKNQQQQPGCGLMRYPSAPTSLLQNHVNGGTTGVIGRDISFDEYEDFNLLRVMNGSVVHVVRVQLVLVAIVGFENSMGAPEMSNGNGSNLVRQSSSPARFSPTKARVMGLMEPRVLRRLAMVSTQWPLCPNLTTDSRNNASLSGLKRARESGGGDLFGGLSELQTKNRDCGDDFTGLTHHLSLAKRCDEMGVVEKFGSEKNGISERMRKLQGLFPNIDRQTNTADMLDMAVEYIKDLQRQVKTLRDTKASAAIEAKPHNTDSNAEEAKSQNTDSNWNACMRGIADF
ncbi:RAB GTPase A4C [Hibiscus syriacus]|uniref:RAB GTPase A4C n=1 Tax=Hibiscus syriacus TaxID=106335 RepID=A0A6A2XWZ3_HIBSY|nr:RAB GTPase A4C [Hibiscus syriacus]